MIFRRKTTIGLEIGTRAQIACKWETLRGEHNGVFIRKSSLRTIVVKRMISGIGAKPQRGFRPVRSFSVGTRYFIKRSQEWEAHVGSSIIHPSDGQQFPDAIKNNDVCLGSKELRILRVHFFVVCRLGFFLSRLEKRFSNRRRRHIFETAPFFSWSVGVGKKDSSSIVSGARVYNFFPMSKSR